MIHFFICTEPGRLQIKSRVILFLWAYERNRCWFILVWKPNKLLRKKETVMRGEIVIARYRFVDQQFRSRLSRRALWPALSDQAHRCCRFRRSGSATRSTVTCAFAEMCPMLIWIRSLHCSRLLSLTLRLSRAFLGPSSCRASVATGITMFCAVAEQKRRGPVRVRLLPQF